MRMKKLAIVIYIKKLKYKIQSLICFVKKLKYKIQYLICFVKKPNYKIQSLCFLLNVFHCACAKISRYVNLITMLVCSAYMSVIRKLNVEVF